MISGTKIMLCRHLGFQLIFGALYLTILKNHSNRTSYRQARSQIFSNKITKFVAPQISYLGIMQIILCTLFVVFIFMTYIRLKYDLKYLKIRKQATCIITISIIVIFPRGFKNIVLRLKQIHLQQRIRVFVWYHSEFQTISGQTTILVLKWYKQTTLSQMWHLNNTVPHTTYVHYFIIDRNK